MEKLNNIKAIELCGNPNVDESFLILVSSQEKSLFDACDVWRMTVLVCQMNRFFPSAIHDEQTSQAVHFGVCNARVFIKSQGFYKVFYVDGFVQNSETGEKIDV